MLSSGLVVLGFLALAASGASAGGGIMLVSRGPFWMGSDAGPLEERPAHRLYLGDFWIERQKVTNAELAEFLEAAGLTSAEGHRRYDHDDPDARIHRRDGRWRPDPGYERHPAVEASWFGARDFCAWRKRRLPTEAEWEKAARGDDGRRYPWGDSLPTAEKAVFGRSYNGTVGYDDEPRGPSPHRVEDLLGNLREWTSTRLLPYPYRQEEAFRGEGRVVVRGASHDDPAASLSVTTRHSYDRRGAAAGHHHVGFRCATSEDLGGY